MEVMPAPRHELRSKSRNRRDVPAAIVDVEGCEARKDALAGYETDDREHPEYPCAHERAGYHCYDPAMPTKRAKNF